MNRELVGRLCREIGTPFFLYDVAKLRDSLANIKDAFVSRYKRTSIAYSVKNCVIPDVIKVIDESEPLYEVTSLGEMLVLNRLGIDISRCIYTNILKPASAIRYAASKGPAIMAVDSSPDLRAVSQIAAELRIRVPVLIRVNPAIHMESTVFASAVPWSKTGIDLGEELRPQLLQMLQQASEDQWLEVLGLHGHLGSQVTNLEYYSQFTRGVVGAFKDLGEGMGFSVIDFGGGYPVQYDPAEEIVSVDDIAAVIVEALARLDTLPRLVIETGRYITANAGSLLTRVVAIKESTWAGRIAVVDASMYNHLLDSVLAHWFFDVEPLEESSPTEEIHVVGCTNDSLDHLDPPTAQTCPQCGATLEQRRVRILPRLAEGDTLIIKGAGAYTTCFCSNYCMLPKPPVVMEWPEGRVDVIYPGESPFQIVDQLFDSDGTGQ